MYWPNCECWIDLTIWGNLHNCRFLLLLLLQVVVVVVVMNMVAVVDWRRVKQWEKVGWCVCCCRERSGGVVAQVQERRRLNQNGPVSSKVFGFYKFISSLSFF